MKAVLLNSGGKDSRVAAALVRTYDEPIELHSLFIDYNHHDDGEAKAAAAVTAQMYCKSHRVWNFPDDWMITKESGVWGLPFKALFCLTLGSMYAKVIGAEMVIAGFDTGLGGEPQKHVQAALNELSTRNGKLLIWTPLTGGEAEKLARELGVNLDGVSSSQ